MTPREPTSDEQSDKTEETPETAEKREESAGVTTGEGSGDEASDAPAEWPRDEDDAAPSEKLAEEAEAPEEDAEAEDAPEEEGGVDDSKVVDEPVVASAEPPAERGEPARMRWLAPVLVAVVGALVLLPCLGSYGLWEPPDSWDVHIQRKARGESAVNRKKKGRFHLPRSELRIAEEARRAVVGSKKAAEKVEASEGKGKRKKKAAAHRLPERPPLTHWLIELGFRVFGVAEWAGRLPLALTGLACLLLLFFVLRRFFDAWVGLAGAAILLGVPSFLLQSRQLTSDVTTTLAALLAVGGLGLGLAPVVRPRRRLWLIAGVVGLLLGDFSRGAVVGMLVPLATVLVAVAVSARLYLADAPPTAAPVTPEAGAPVRSGLRSSFVIQVVALAATVVTLAVVAWVLLAVLAPKHYSAFLGETPLAASKVLSYPETKTPTYQWAVFDVLVKQLGFGTFPWIALLPVGLALMFRRGDGAPPPVPALDDEAARLDRFGRTLLVSWFVVAIVVGTYWVLRFGDLDYPALPAVAGVVAVLLVDLVRRKNPPRLMLGLSMVVVVLALLYRDQVEFPETLVSAHINYNLHFPPEVSYKRFIRYVVLLPFGLLAVAFFACRGRTSPVRGPGNLKEWFTPSGTDIGRWFGLRLDDGPDTKPRVTTGGVVRALLLIGLLMVAGGSALWSMQRRPTPGLWVAGVFLAPILLPLLPFVFASIVDALLFAYETAWQLVTGRFWDGDLLLYGRDEVTGVGGLWQRLFALNPALIVVLFPTAVGMALAYMGRLALRALVVLAVLIGLLPVTIYSALRHRKGAELWPSVDSFIAGTLVVVPLVLSCYLGFSLVPRLSHHFSYKAIIDTYNHSHDRSSPEPLALFKVSSRSPVFYTKGPLIRGGELRKRYPRGRDGSPIVQYLAKGWTDAKGHQFDRVYAILPVDQLGKLDRDAHARDPAVPYYVLDARNSFYVLISNRLGKMRRGGKLVAEKDLNPLLKFVRNERPELRCEARENMQCIPLRVRLAERKGDKEPSLELIGAKIPKVVSAGSKFDVVLYFKVLKRLQGKYKVFLHIDGRGNRVLGDHDPVGGRYHTTLWLPGRWVIDRYTLPASASSRVSTPNGIYQVYAGLFQGDRRMEVLSGPQDGKNRVKVGRMRFGSRGGCGCGR